MKKASITGKSFLLVWLVASCMAFLTPAGAQQPVGTSPNVTGIVTTASGQPIPGASVFVRGTKIAVATGSDGHFAIAATSGQVLVINSMGFNPKEVKVTGNGTLTIQLQENVQQLKDVMIVGYGVMKKTDQSSAQVSISSADISKTVNTTMDQAIQGRAAGVYVTQNSGQPGGGISVNIRGISTISGTTEPLYVIDGVQIQPTTVAYGNTSSTNPLAGINPADIESIDILQGPSATAIYGSRGTNGVVLVTTKRGSKGMKVGYSFLYTNQERPDRIATMNLQQFAIMNNEIAKELNRTPTAEFQNPAVLGQGTDWQRALFKTAPMQKHQLTISNSSNNTDYYLSGEYMKQDGVAIGSDFGRYSFRLNLDNRATKWLKLSTSLNFYQTKERLSSTSEDVIRTALQLAPNVPVTNPDGSWGGATTNEYGSNAKYVPVNPVAIANLVDNSYKRTGGMGGTSLEITFMPGLIFRTSFNGNFEYSDGSKFTPTYQLGYQQNSTATLAVSSNKNFFWILNELVQYNKTIGKHALGVMASHEAQAYNYQGLSAQRFGFATNSLPSLNLGDVAGQTTGASKGSGAMESYLARINYTYADKYILQLVGRADGSSNFGELNRWGYFPSVSAAWRVSQEPFMKAVSFINDLKIRAEYGITGNSGNGNKQFSNLAPVTTPFGTGFATSQYGNANLWWEPTQTKNVGFNLSILNNRVQIEGDFYARNTDKLLLYNPLPVYMGTQSEGAISPPFVNIGAMKTNGFGITLNTVNIQHKSGFVWKSNFNISSFKSTITKFYSDKAFVDKTLWSMNFFTQRSAVGQAPWLFYGYVAEGLFTSVDQINKSAVPAQADGSRLPTTKDGGVWVGDIKYKDLNNDGIIDSRDQTFIGNPWPKFTYGFSNTFSYKGFDLNILLTGVSGNQIFNYVRFENSQPNNINLGRNLMVDAFDYARVTNDGDKSVITNVGTKVPRLVANDVNGNSVRFTNNYVEDGSYLRIKNIQLGYNFPGSLLNMQNVIKALRISVGVQNLATITKYKGFDPEVGAYIGKEVQLNAQYMGVDAGRYPLTRMYSASVSVDF
ncbi:TonB-linked SusC/RagA family outer membrane protein [Chitinophaga dinghuensis]|uniref:TonB-linked SusC/RagA family outer membrane protein n=1 Tax=Chitinophaga dinghuensis TaxID=1539050 RepID=A0A327VQF4_9BACT|nr:TonB-dependent receptor [Chitinophaga dinghuensis]RAJ77525.1 TonB-linked SusC/RagA family outer membrane protein [Chitinophaga dinghuensis]